ncbi:hypothetical protein GGF32_004049 [Allomyces javanicus]|nr:hypothetical protein GGF32_004049 [Allomyces javanicus]
MGYLGIYAAILHAFYALDVRDWFENAMPVSDPGIDPLDPLEVAIVGEQVDVVREPDQIDFLEPLIESMIVQKYRESVTAAVRAVSGVWSKYWREIPDGVYIAHVLNLNYKLHHVRRLFIHEGVKQARATTIESHIKERILAAMQQYLVSERPVVPPLSLTFKLFMLQSAHPSPHISHEQLFAKELDLYLADPACILDIVDTPEGASEEEWQCVAYQAFIKTGAWWQMRVSQYPTLFQLARDYAHFEPTIANAERTFSMAGHKINKKTAPMMAETVEEHVVMKDWLRGAAKPYSHGHPLHGRAGRVSLGLAEHV